MCGMLDNYLQAFAQLRTASNHKDLDEASNYMSPNKPLLLLAVLDLIGCGSITRNYIEPSFELAEAFRQYLCLLKPAKMSSMSYPFLFLLRDGFWHLRSKSGADLHPSQLFGTVQLLNENYYGAVLNDDLFALVQMESSRKKLRRVLIETYFSADMQSLLWKQEKINREAVNYSLSLLATADVHPIYDLEEEIPVPDKKIRMIGFRKAVLLVYDHHCALCGLKIIGPDYQTAVDAFHIIPWNRSRDDHPGNGLALCKLCRWAFHEGLLSVDNEYRVLVSNTVQNDCNQPGYLLSLSGKSIFQPAEYKYWPTQESFKWHRHTCFWGGG